MNRGIARFVVPVALVSVVGGMVALAEESGEKPSKEHYQTPEQPGLAVGEAAPDFTLKTADGQDVTLSELWAKQPVILTFYRGGWCPFCTKALAGWQDEMDEIAEAGATFVAITPEKPEFIAKTAEEFELGYTVLSDANGDAQRAYNLQFTLDEKTVEKYKGYGIDLGKQNADGTWTLPAPATFVIDTGGEITYVWADWDYRKRAEPKEVIAEVRKLAAETE